MTRRLPDARKRTRGLKMVTRNLSFPPAWLDAIDAIAEREGVTGAEVVRQAVADYLDLDPDHGHFGWGQGRRGPLQVRRRKAPPKRVEEP